MSLDRYLRALPFFRRVGDRFGEAVTLYDIALIHRRMGRLEEAVGELEQAIELDRLTRHSGLDSSIRMLQDIRQQRRGWALSLFVAGLVDAGPLAAGRGRPQTPGVGRFSSSPHGSPPASTRRGPHLVDAIVPLTRGDRCASPLRCEFG
ncbi:tetratricopeptide repeat protein [Raineyella antarctica]|uniref:tetratricopeptide repeat protein n=1 Tax=Raineyella antarctica TaxID=1577474 RepID=UPI0011147B5E